MAFKVVRQLAGNLWRDEDGFFTLQAEQVSQLYSVFRPELAELFRDIFANCGQQLAHRGDVILQKPPRMRTWGRAFEGWTNAAGNGSYVRVHPCMDRDGNNADGSETVTVYLPRNSGLDSADVSGMDPNVQKGSVIAYAKDNDGKAFCISGYLDDKINTVKAWDGDIDEISPGWEVVTTINSVSVNTPEQVRRLVPYIDPADFPGNSFDTAGNTGGTNKHNHADHELGSHVCNNTTVDVVVTALLPSTTIACGTTGIRVDDPRAVPASEGQGKHPHHQHEWVSTEADLDDIGPVIKVVPEWPAQHPCFGNEIDSSTCQNPTSPWYLTHVVREPACPSGGLGHFHTAVTSSPLHDHTVDAHNHTISDHADLQHVAKEHIDNWIATIYIKRTS